MEDSTVPSIVIDRSLLSEEELRRLEEEEVERESKAFEARVESLVETLKKVVKTAPTNAAATLPVVISDGAALTRKRSESWGVSPRKDEIGGDLPDSGSRKRRCESMTVTASEHPPVGESPPDISPRDISPRDGEGQQPQQPLSNRAAFRAQYSGRKAAVQRKMAEMEAEREKREAEEKAKADEEGTGKAKENGHDEAENEKRKERKGKGKEKGKEKEPSDDEDNQEESSKGEAEGEGEGGGKKRKSKIRKGGAASENSIARKERKKEKDKEKKKRKKWLEKIPKSKSAPLRTISSGAVEGSKSSRVSQPQHHIPPAQSHKDVRSMDSVPTQAVKRKKISLRKFPTPRRTATLSAEDELAAASGSESGLEGIESESHKNALREELKLKEEEIKRMAEEIKKMEEEVKQLERGNKKPGLIKRISDRANKTPRGENEKEKRKEEREILIENEEKKWKQREKRAEKEKMLRKKREGEERSRKLEGLGNDEEQIPSPRSPRGNKTSLLPFATSPTVAPAVVSMVNEISNSSSSSSDEGGGDEEEEDARRAQELLLLKQKRDVLSEKINAENSLWF